MRRIAIWNGNRQAWESPLGSIDLFSTLSDVYLETWPSSGMWEGGSVFELPTPALHTVDSGSSLLPTPRASRGASGTETMYALGAERDDSARTQGHVILPTPRVSDSNGPGVHGTGSPDLRTVVSLLPTPQVADVTGGHKSRSGSRSNELLLPGVAETLAAQLLGESTDQPSDGGNV